ncbi:thiol reductant ABC exporter subunit CydD [Marinomonas posidonica]|uniref:ABC transporter, CydDC cysteine exporter (CydDC-E) family, permease/ATP-binding protein CydD n=1 Tax=Marinomonas posidonica (strain CECT 7376 / NCIMB 14433 / IVIA-Po-181) TaxID=491952 RepID=F6CV01_MARPP|nr:thiol reductant ABC exporter subunit CydD [Marinomonas posidonica]AEF55327.1 ABC transporter, CydDC cysteine exporter (CydDC-E) family, permease/ATP-binding protein CydD [Marinomonas posidonica IVIA-Po-181]
MAGSNEVSRAKKATRVKPPEAMFLGDLANQQAKRYRLAQGFGALFAVALVLQAWAFANVFSDMVLSQEFSIFFLMLALFALLLRALANYGRERVCASASRHIRYGLRHKLISHLTQLGPARLRIEEDAALSTRVYEQVDALDDYYSRYKPQVFMVTLIPCVILLSVIPVSWVAFWVFMITAPLVIVFMIFVGHKAAQANRRQFNVLAMLSNQFMDLSQGLAELKRLDRTGEARERLSYSAQVYQKTTMGVLLLAFLSTATLELFASLAIAMIALYLGLGLLEILPWQVGVAPVTLTQAMFLLLLAPEFYLPLRQLGNDYHAKQKAEAAATDLMSILNTPLSVQKAQVVTTEYTPSSVQLSYLSFYQLAWHETGRQRLAPITADIQQGERVWLSGVSGVGKSSLLHLLLGFEEGYQGQLFVKGKPFDQLDLSIWRSKLAWLPQTPEWVNGSIRRNLLLGITPPSDSAIQAALRDSQCEAFIKALPKGLDTPLTELGSGLSGGQMQRLSIARAMLSKAEVWLLDEPCSGLDTETADAVLETLEKVSQGKTLLMVSHDTHPIHWADKHWVLEHGGLHEQVV